jgi:hypothetical protein
MVKIINILEVRSGLIFKDKNVSFKRREKNYPVTQGHISEEGKPHLPASET